ncbi:FxLYD domain-containing protein [Streptomyces sp. NPDC055036]
MSGTFQTWGVIVSNGYPPPHGQQQPWGQQPPGPGWGAPPPKKSNTGLIVVLSIAGGLVLMVLLGLLIGSGADGVATAERSAEAKPTESQSAPAEAPAKAESKDGPEGDVKVTGCSVDDFTGWPSADVLIKNRSTEKSNYVVSVEFVDSSGKRLGEGLAASNNVAAGQKVETKAQSLDKVTVKVECRVTEVTRYAS